ncbi:class I SAM-dependent methyltransferase [Microbacterium suwonense]|uniref:Methyltransferase type 11 domain-containing protein n=1 Tax=Microbacterium suwonense TaxID=683047 RepID=A0ABN6X5Y5_9MICO|nr:class I SAM-dependent methyltransferase [Microbacterium suwonense]BDZ39615.1 hypothetical protein GCM10025863_22290 [Microbacterium suwonense]
MRAGGFWSAYARVYDTIWDSPLTGELARCVHALLPGSGVVVDLGCGTGLMARGVGARVVGVDSEPAMLDRALREGRIEEGRHALAEASGLPDACAQAVLVCNVLHFHPNPAAVVAEARRLCTKGAILVLTWPVPGLDTDDLLRWDRIHGRDRLDAWWAHLLRSSIGIRSAVTRAVTVSAPDSSALIDADDVVLSDGVVAGCQHLLALRV